MKKFAYLALCILSISTNALYADCGNGGGSLDPRVPPAGVYTTQNGNGSSQTLYTTGETKPYNADINSNCNNNATNGMIVQPNVFPPQQHR